MIGKEQRVMVTGGAGMIGSQLVKLLVTDPEWRDCAAIVVVDNLVNGRRENIAKFLGDRARLVVADIRHQTQMAELLRGVHTV